MQRLATQDKVRLRTESIRGLYLVAVKLITVQVTKLSLLNGLGQKRHNLLCKAWIDEGVLYKL